jgi:hypothetical protein
MGSELGEARCLDLQVWGFGSRGQGFGFGLNLGLTLRKENPPETTVSRIVASTQMLSVSS